jgi:hypothetical protein
MLQQTSSHSAAPAVLALLCTLDIVLTLSLSLLSIDTGHVLQALIPNTGDWKLDTAAQLYDLLLLGLLRSSLALAPVCGARWIAGVAGLIIYTLLNLLSTAWLILKSVFSLQLAHDGQLAIPSTGVELSIGCVVAAQVWGLLAAWIQLLVIFISRKVFHKPQRQQCLPIYTTRSSYSARQSVEEWISGATSDAGGLAASEIQAPLLSEAGTYLPPAPGSSAPVTSRLPHQAAAAAAGALGNAAGRARLPGDPSKPLTQGLRQLHIPGTTDDINQLQYQVGISSSPGGESFATGRSSPGAGYSSAASFSSAVSPSRLAAFPAAEQSG